MAMQLLKLLIILFSVLLLRNRFICLVRRSLTYKTPFLRNIDRISFISLGNSMLWNAYLLTLMLVTASRQKVKRVQLIRPIRAVNRTGRVSQHSIW